MTNKPKKKNDNDLFSLIETKINSGEYIFLNHARQRLIDRSISDLEVLNILEGKKGTNRHRNKAKDKYENDKEDWNYCVQGKNPDGKPIRIIISFANEVLPIITMMWIRQK